MGLWRNVEEQIRQAMEDGAFDDLPGKGEPLNIEENPFDPPEWRVAHHLLRSNGFSLPWIEERKEIEAMLAAERQALARAWRWRRRVLAAGQPVEKVEARWQQITDAFRARIAELNRLILSHNLKTPHPCFQRFFIDAEEEIQRITRV